MPSQTYDNLQRDNWERLWLQPNLIRNAQLRALEQLYNTKGRAWPCSVISVNQPLVTVKFEVTTQGARGQAQLLPQITIPIAMSQWFRIPVQVGDIGITLPADTFLGGVTGQGSGVANTTKNYGNLGATLVFLPIGLLSFPSMPDTNKPWVNGPNGAVVSDTAQTVVSTNDAALRQVSHKVLNAEGTGATSVEHLLDGILNRITHQVTNEIGTVITLVDGANNVISHVVPNAAGNLSIIIDGAGNVISHVLPTGGILGLGALASDLDATRAVPAHADIVTLTNNIISQTLQTLATAIGTAAVTAGIPESAAFAAILGAAGWVAGLSGINPTIPSFSSIVRVSV